MIWIKSGKKTGIIIAILIVIIVAVALVSYKQNEEPTTVKSQLTLADYPEIFKKDVIIVIGENANSIEIEAAQRIVDNLGNLNGNMPVIKTDSEITEDELAGHNLILVGGADSNEVLREVYDMTDVMRVTDEYPGAGKGVLEILKSPWDSKKAVLLVAGSDEWGVKAGMEMIERCQDLDKTNSVVKWKRNDTKIEDGRVVKVPKTVDSDGNRIADNLEKKLKNSTYRRIDDDLADVIISLNHAPDALDEIQIEKFGGKVYEKWDELVYALHASLPASNITIYMSQHPNVVLIEENSEMYANSGDKIQRNVSLEMIGIKEEMKK